MNSVHLLQTIQSIEKWRHNVLLPTESLKT